MRESWRTILVLILAGVISVGGHARGETAESPVASPYSVAPASLGQEYPSLVPLLLKPLEPTMDDMMRKAVVVPALRRMGQSSVPALVKMLAEKNPKQRIVALLCLSDLVGPDYPARAAIPAVMRLANETGDDDSQGYALIVLTRLIAVNEPGPSAEKIVMPCKGEPIFRGPMASARYIRPDGKVEELTLTSSERGTIVSVYADYLVLESNRGLERYTRCVKYKDIIELSFLR